MWTWRSVTHSFEGDHDELDGHYWQGADTSCTRRTTETEMPKLRKYRFFILNV